MARRMMEAFGVSSVYFTQTTNLIFIEPSA